ncbi:MAG: FAD-dependent oxidoreductase [Myxococcota bacterium]|nr:FAD-dependent oxidoreductase [Myxococcota bacterium]
MARVPSSIPSHSEAYWIATCPGRHYPPLDGDREVDVVVVGGGITGITAALLLQRAGKHVAVLEARRIAAGVTGHTTAHLTEALDARYATLVRDFGAEGARLAAQASRAAIEQIAHLVDSKAIDCGWRRLPGYLYTEREADLEALHLELEAAKSVGLMVDMTRDVPLPFPARAALRFEDQAELHVREYLFPLCDEIEQRGGLLFEGSRVIDIEEDEPCRVVTERGTVRAQHVIVAANAPLNRILLQTKIAHYRSYALALRVSQPRLGGLFWDTDDPYHYLRSAPDEARRPGDTGSLLIVGGEDHKTGTDEHTQARFESLLAYANERFTVEEVGFRWSAQVVEPADGLPLIGKNAFASRVYVATGYSGNGITFGTAAGMLLCDQVLQRENPWSKLFDPGRIKPLASVKDFIAENADVGLHMIGDRLRAPDATHLREVGPGEGKIVRIHGRRLAVFRDPSGALHALSPVCPHLGCQVHFNDAEKSWDCPCHGSRFGVEGEVLNGPAMRGLEPVVLGGFDEDEPEMRPIERAEGFSYLRRDPV